MVEMTPREEGGSCDMVCKLTDFGFSCVLDPGSNLSLVLGTPLYMAPELMRSEQYDRSVDIWALGVITFGVLTSTYPFDGKNKNEVEEKVKSEATKPKYELLDRFWRNGEPVKSFIQGCLAKDPTQRLTAE